MYLLVPMLTPSKKISTAEFYFTLLSYHTESSLGHITLLYPKLQYSLYRSTFNVKPYVKSEARAIHLNLLELCIKVPILNGQLLWIGPSIFCPMVQNISICYNLLTKDWYLNILLFEPYPYNSTLIHIYGSASISWNLSYVED